MMSETLVRAAVVRWDLAENGAESAEGRMAGEEKNSFFWIREFSDLLGTYEARRDLYPDLESFFPEIEASFDGYASRAKDHIEKVKAGWEAERKAMAASAPVILTVVPPDGTRDVDPARTAIVITFDRPMKDRAWGVMRVDGAMPEITGDVYYDETRTVFTIPVRLKPDTAYTIGLNSENAPAFQDEEGNPLMPVVIRFKTRARR
jgi:hypothetical protein